MPQAHSDITTLSTSLKVHVCPPPHLHFSCIPNVCVHSLWSSGNFLVCITLLCATYSSITSALAQKQTANTHHRRTDCHVGFVDPHLWWYLYIIMHALIKPTTAQTSSMHSKAGRGASVLCTLRHDLIQRSLATTFEKLRMAWGLRHVEHGKEPRSSWLILCPSKWIAGQ